MEKSRDFSFGVVNGRLELHGRLDYSNSPEFHRGCHQVFDSASGDKLIVDCQNLNYIDSAGVCALISLHERAQQTGTSLHMRNCSRSVRHVLGLLRIGTFS